MVCCKSCGQIRHDSVKPSLAFVVAQAGDRCENGRATRHEPFNALTKWLNAGGIACAMLLTVIFDELRCFFSYLRLSTGKGVL
jgi:hypothetical protein